MGFGDYLIGDLINIKILIREKPMNKKEKIKFIRQLTKSVANDIIQKIKDNKIPKEWDGVELRQFLFDKFSPSFALRYDKKRRRNYISDIEKLNL